MLLLEREKPDCIVVALDAPGKTFRDEEYEDYKAGRMETPDELQSQLAIARDFIEAIGLPQIEVPGYEADDIIGTLTADAEKNNIESIIVTGDLDTLQLVDKDTTVMTTRTGVSDVVYYDPKAVEERFGILPQQVPDFKALKGDPSDNIPGVPGIGDKSAAVLLQRYGNIENLIKNIDKVEDKYKKKIEPVIDQVPMYKRLATIQKDAPIHYDYKPFKISREDLKRAEEMLDSLEFRMHKKRYPQVLAPYLDGNNSNAQASLDLLIEEQTLETEKLDSLEQVVKWSKNNALAVYQDNEEYAIATVDKAAKVPKKVFFEIIERQIQHLAFHHAKNYLKQAGVYERPSFDTLIAAYVLQSSRTSYDLGDLVTGYLDEKSPKSSAECAYAIARLVGVMTEQIKKENQWHVLDELEVPLIPVLAKMEVAGIQVDAKVLHEISKQLNEQIVKLENSIHTLAGHPFNIGSPQQLGKVLFEELQLQPTKKTKTGYATGVEVLQQLAPEHEIVRQVLQWRELTKLKSTYTDALPKMIADDGRIHTTFAQTVAATGRLSSIDPNLQNIPVRSEIGREIRRAFTAPKGFQLASLDYSQIELRILAHYCEDPTLVEAFSKGIDVHAATAAIMFSVPVEQINKQQRRYAKILNYAVLYGVTDYGLANQLGGEFTTSQAKELIKNYFERFPKVREYVQQTLAEARSKGYTTTITGRRRYFPDIHAGNRVARQYAERQAMNAPLQGSSADLIKVAMLRVDQRLKGAKTRMILQVHDELVFELADNEHDLLPELQQLMANAIKLNVPVEVDVSVGPNWLEAKSG